MINAATSPPPRSSRRRRPGPLIAAGETLEAIPAGGSGMVKPDRGAAVTAFDPPGGTGFAAGVRVELTFRAWRWWVARTLPDAPAV